MAKKLILVFGVVAFFIGTFLFVLSMQGFWNSQIDYALNDTVITSGNHAENFSAYKSALDYSRLFPLGAITLVSGLTIFVILRQPEVAEKIKGKFRR